MKPLTRILSFILVTCFLYGCASPKYDVALSESFWKDKKHNIVVTKTQIANKPCLLKIGPQGFLDYAINSIATKDFDKYLQKSNLDWYRKLPQKFVDQLKARHILAKVNPTDINQEQKKNATVAIQMDGDKLLLLELMDLGAIRNYSGFMPTSAPKAYCLLKGELIDRQSKEILWSHLAQIEEVVQGNWDQPPSYPNFTVALGQAIDSAQEEVIDSFFSGH